MPARAALRVILAANDAELDRAVAAADALSAGIRRSVTVRTAAQALACDIATVYKLIRDGRLVGHRLGDRGVRIYADSIRAYQEGRPLGPAQSPHEPRAPRRARDASFAQACLALRKRGIL